VDDGARETLVRDDQVGAAANEEQRLGTSVGRPDGKDFAGPPRPSVV